ncbi:MAG TPA: rhamnogalacturonan acetylesterase [Burkholderiaceae bacterium]|jgi:lysophospholipase L1-like esterase
MKKEVLIAAGLALAAVCGHAETQPVRVILVGDSTLAPKNGYGDALCARFKPEVRCLNMAKNGRSSGSYRAEGSWQQVMDELKNKGAYANSYVLIEFGHNDQPGKPGRSTDLATEFPVNLTRYVDEVRSLGGTPVLATPLTRRSFKAGVLVNDLGPWADVTRSVAKARNVPLVELLATSEAAVQAMGEVEADTLAVEPPPKVSAAPADMNSIEAVSNKKSAFDHTHVGPKGAELFAVMVERLLRGAVPALAPRFMDGDVAR